MTTIGNIEHLVDKLCTTVSSLRNERDRLRAQVDELKSKFAEKDLELIRAGKENQRTLEVLEREKLALQKEKNQIEAQLKAIYERISTLMPELTGTLSGAEGERSAKG